ncbi:MAG: DUF6162 family protein [Halodesulfovibrio sp.]|uniref:DUF6162 family protein n=1 Tax=Halodesulfovibrio sp. TaxID=1912772 RepID=UPI00359D0937
MSVEQAGCRQQAYFTIVPPATGKGETRYVVALLCLILLVTGIFVHIRARADVKMELESWQISAFHHLEGTDQAVFSALYTASEDVVSMHHELGHWPTINELQEFFLSPFSQDLSWKQWGEIHWSLLLPESSGADTAVYAGIGGIAPEQDAFLMVFSHVHAPSEEIQEPITRIWVNENSEPEVPVVFTPDSLVRKGWKQVLPYDGEMEVRRLKG